MRPETCWDESAICAANDTLFHSATQDFWCWSEEIADSEVKEAEPRNIKMVTQPLPQEIGTRLVVRRPVHVAFVGFEWRLDFRRHRAQFIIWTRFANRVIKHAIDSRQGLFQLAGVRARGGFVFITDFNEQ